MGMSRWTKRVLEYQTNEYGFVQLVQNDKTRMEQSLAACNFLADLLARYVKIETHYRRVPFEGAHCDVGELENAIVNVYIAILKYSTAVKSAAEGSVISEGIPGLPAKLMR